MDESNILHSFLGSVGLDIGLVVLVYCVGFIFADSIAANGKGCGEGSC